MYQDQEKRRVSGLSGTVEGFSKALSALLVLLLAPILEKEIRPEIYRYFLDSFPADISLWSSWAFIGISALCLFFGISGVIQIVIHFIVRKSARKAVY